MYLRDQNIANNFTSGLLWSTSIITTVWRKYFALWDLRNKAVHREDLKTRQSARKRKLAVKLHHLHNKRDSVLQTNRKIYLADSTVELDKQIATANVHHLKNWIRVWRPVILDSVKTAAALAIQAV